MLCYGKKSLSVTHSPFESLCNSQEGGHIILATQKTRTIRYNAVASQSIELSPF